MDKKGNKLGEAKPFKKKGVPKAEIALEDTKRDSTDWVQQVVEVGVNNSLLQNGHLEFVDAPGMSENDNLDSIVQECLDGVLQVIIYVIDGNSSLRTQVNVFYRICETANGKTGRQRVGRKGRQADRQTDRQTWSDCRSMHTCIHIHAYIRT